MHPVGFKDLEVLDPVVSFVTVDVVNNFVWLQIATQVLLHHEPMLADIAAGVSMWMTKLPHKDVPGLVYDTPALPIAVLCPWLRATTSKQRKIVGVEKAANLLSLDRQVKFPNDFRTGHALCCKSRDLVFPRHQ